MVWPEEVCNGGEDELEIGVVETEYGDRQNQRLIFPVLSPFGDRKFEKSFFLEVRYQMKF